jgi:phosphatidylserine/phosphatidylglycerophosphate/cardiolipin synthase-like enzyme
MSPTPVSRASFSDSDLSIRQTRGYANHEATALHAKLMAADEKVAVVGSANLTDRALADNIELGVIIRDPHAVERVVRHFRSLMKPGIGPLEPSTAGN